MDFLKAVLNKVGKNSNSITKDSPYTFQFFAPPMWKGQAISVGNVTDYSAMMGTIKAKVQTTVLIDMSDVMERPSVSPASIFE